MSLSPVFCSDSLSYKMPVLLVGISWMVTVQTGLRGCIHPVQVEIGKKIKLLSYNKIINSIVYVICRGVEQKHLFAYNYWAFQCCFCVCAASLCNLVSSAPSREVHSLYISTACNLFKYRLESRVKLSSCMAERLGTGMSRRGKKKVFYPPILNKLLTLAVQGCPL